MERKVGEIFEFGGEWYQCIEQPKDYIGNVCRICDFRDTGNCKFVKCCGDRDDKTPVVFKKLEKLGDPFERQGHLYQEYKAHTFPLLMNGGVKLPTPNGFPVLTKQNQEDMEEKKIQHYDCFFDREPSKSNLKPFSLEAAKAGKPICTRDRRKARIICFDLKNGNHPIVAAVECEEYEVILYYTIKGEISENIKSENDLMMLPEKKEGWVNLYKSSAHSTKEEAMKYRNKCDDYIDTIKVSWEE